MVSNADLTLDTILASACLPRFFRAVEIDDDGQARFHRVGPPAEGLLHIGSAADRSPRFLRALWDAGRTDARRFLIRDGKSIGVDETLDLKAEFIDQRKTRLAMTAVDGEATPRGATRTQPAMEP